MEFRVVMKRAKHIANSQGTLAASPAEIGEDGTLTLCAASCIARAAIELYGDSNHVREFEARVVSEDKLEYLPALFRQLGLSEHLARATLAENDSRPESSRLDWFNALPQMRGRQNEPIQ